MVFKPKTSKPRTSILMCGSLQESQCEEWDKIEFGLLFYFCLSDVPFTNHIALHCTALFGTGSFTKNIVIVIVAFCNNVL